MDNEDTQEAYASLLEDLAAKIRNGNIQVSWLQQSMESAEYFYAGRRFVYPTGKMTVHVVVEDPIALERHRTQGGSIIEDKKKP